MPTTTYDQARAMSMWRSCLASAFRTTLTCTIIGCTTLYGPESLRRHIRYPAFSYVTAILIVTDAKLGDTLRGCWLALYATVQGVGPAILSLWAIGPARLTTNSTALAVALSSFVVALPNSTHLVSKRIALGQIVIVYVIAFINGVHTDAVMHPVHVAVSTAVGVLACVLSFLLPYPSLACYEVKQNCNLFADNASQRLKLYVKAFSAEDTTCALALISQAKSLAVTATKLLQTINCKQESMQWERFPIKFLRPYCMNPGDRLQDLEIPLRGMNIALTSSPSIPVRMLDQDLKDGVITLHENIVQTLDHIKSRFPFDSLTVPESNQASVMKYSSLTLQTIIPPTQKDLPSFFFLFCLKLLYNKTIATSSINSAIEGSIDHSLKKDRWFFRGIWSSWTMNISKKRLMPAFRCSLSVGLAVFFGLLYSKKNGYWSGLPVAISFASAREATFKAANVKAHGTVLGTVYGVLGCFLFEKFMQIRFMSLLPWFIFTSFLRNSRMYGQAGGVSATIGAVLILGRNNFGPPTEFAIARIIETFIGLSCSIIVDILLQPTRASTLAKFQLSQTLQALHECVNSISLHSGKAKLEENQKKLKTHVDELRKLIGEAEVEPNFWFLPFHSACYGKLLVSLSKMVDLLLFGAYAIGFLEQESKKINIVWKEAVDKLDGDLKLLKEMSGFSTKCFEEIKKKLLEKNMSDDLELGKPRNPNSFDDLELGKPRNPNNFGVSASDEDEREKIINSYLQHSKEVVDRIHDIEGEYEFKNQVVLSLTALAFCMSSLIKERREIENRIKEIIQWENPSNKINL